MEYETLSSSIKMMSPYGGTIYVTLSNDASFDMTIDGAIEMPYFIQGTKFNFSEVVLVFLGSHLRIIFQEKQQMMNSMK